MREYLSKGRGIIIDGMIKSDSSEILYLAIMIALTDGDFTHYGVVNNVLKFFSNEYSAKKNGGVKLPYVLTKDNAFDFIYNCMKGIDDDKIPYEYEDGDGSHGFGFIAKFFDFGHPTIKISVINLYYSK